MSIGIIASLAQSRLAAVHVFLGSNHAPLWVFVLLGAIIAAVAVILYFANTPGGGEGDYLYADPSNRYFGSPGGFVSPVGRGFGGFGGL